MAGKPAVPGLGDELEDAMQLLNDANAYLDQLPPPDIADYHQRDRAAQHRRRLRAMTPEM